MLSLVVQKLVMLEKVIKWLESNLLSCHYKKFLGVECPGCGMQRSLIELLKGDIEASFILFPALIPLILLFLFLGLHLIFKFNNGALAIKILFIVCVSIMILGYFYKLLN